MVGMAYNLLKNPSDLKAHKLNDTIYGLEVVDEDLLDSIKNKGILESLVIKDDNTIISGHRRWLAAKKLHLKNVPCRTIVFNDDLDEKETLIEFNRQRKKTPSQLMKESDMISEIESERAKQIQNKAGELKPANILLNQPTDSKELGVMLPQAPVDTQTGMNKKRDPKARAKVADKIGMKESSYIRLKKVWDESKTGNETAKKLMDELDEGETTINKAHNTIKQHKKKDDDDKETKETTKEHIKEHIKEHKPIIEGKQDRDHCIYIPFTPVRSQVAICPCGCGYGYCMRNETWYNSEEIENLEDE